MAHDILLIVMTAILSGVGMPIWITALILRHRQKMRELEYIQKGSPKLVEEVAALREELNHLRDTTTQFDMGHDAAVARLETRLERLEGNASAFPSPVYPTTTVAQNISGRG